MADGYLGKCKECTKADSDRRYKAKMEDPAFIISERRRNRVRVAVARSEGRGPAQSPDAKRAWAKRNREKVNAEQKLRRAVAAGLVEPKPCEVCGAKAQAHHPDYSKPLEVKWLCLCHHHEEHVRMREERLT